MAASARPKSAKKFRILIVDEDTTLAGFLGSELRPRGFLVDHLDDSEEAKRVLVEKGQYDLLLLEINLSKIDGISLIKHLRPLRPRLAIFVITSRNRVEDKVLAFQSGADDCLTKPLSLAELFARIEALLRRNSGHLPNRSTVSDLMLCRDEHRVERNGRRIELTPREFALLDVMMQNVDRPVSRTTLLEQVWNVNSEPSTNVVDVYVKYVRDKVDRTGEPRLIHTVRGVGYELRSIDGRSE